MGKGFNSSSSKNAHTKRYERKSENSGRFGSSGASDKRRSVTSDENQPRQPRVSASGKREHNEKSHKENVATPSSEFGRVPKKRKISPSVDLATPVGIATSRRLPMRSLNENEQSTVASQHQVQMRSLDRKEEAVVQKLFDSYTPENASEVVAKIRTRRPWNIILKSIATLRDKTYIDGSCINGYLFHVGSNKCTSTQY